MKIPNYIHLPQQWANFNWFAVLKDLAQGAPLTTRDHSILVQMAGNWPTCACGQLCSALPRAGNDPKGPPADLWLRQWGVQFAHEVNAKHWPEALDLMHKIDARSTVLLNGCPL